MDDADRLNSPLLPPRFLPGAPDEPFRFQGIPGIEATRGGNRFAVWYGGGDGEGPQNFLMLARRNPKNPDEWPIVLRVVHPGREIRCFDAALWLDPAGKLRLFWSQSRCRETGKDVSDGVNGVWQSVCAEPDAPVPNWTRPERLCDGIMLNKPCIASDGSWLLPVSVWGDGIGGGKLPESLRDVSGANLFVSTDGGQSWTPPQRSRLRGPGSRFALRRLKSGSLLLINHQCGVPFSPVREKLTAYLSDDDGESWTAGMMIDPRTGVSYPDFTEESNGAILCVYDRDRYGDGEILLAEFTPDDVRKGVLPRPPQTISALRNRTGVNTEIPTTGEQIKELA